MINIQAGLRVIRGPDWKWSDEDGGEGTLGTVITVEPKSENGTLQKGLVSVLWDFSIRASLYRIGADNSYDLRVYDTGPIGVTHKDFTCDACVNKSKGIIGSRYSCSECNNYDLCSSCYNNGAHLPSHSFYRIDMPESPKILLQPRQTSKTCLVRGFSIKAKVTRGFHWEWNDQDGKPGKSGRIVSIQDHNGYYRSTAKVCWSAGKRENVYRIGVHGKIDLKCVESETWPCFKEHLPVLGVPVISQSESIVRGDRVIISLDAEHLEYIQKQKSKGGWSPAMVKFIGKIGTVHRVTDQGSIRVRFDDCELRWTFDSRALTKVDFCVGDQVRFIPDEKHVREHLKGHGDWTDRMADDLGKLGVVNQVYDDKDLRVAFEKNVWTLSPKCVELVKSSTSLDANSPTSSGIQKEIVLESGNYARVLPANVSSTSAHINILNPDVFNSRTSISNSSPNVLDVDSPLVDLSVPNNDETPTRDIVIQTMTAVVRGNPQAINTFLEKYKTSVDCPGQGGKTLLHIAAHQGCIEQVRTLIQNKACIYYPDDSGDTALHFAVFGNNPDMVQLLIEAGANLDVMNKLGCTPLHVAVNNGFSDCAHVLLQNGCDVNVQDVNQDTPLHDAIRKNLEHIQELLVHHAEINLLLENNKGFNILHDAVLRGNRSATEMILEKDPNLVHVPKTCDGFTPLHIASCNGHLEIVKLLVEKYSADMNVIDRKNKTPIMVAVGKAEYSVINYLTQNKVNLTIQDQDGNSILHILFAKRTSYRKHINRETAPQIYTEFLQKGGPFSDYGNILAVTLYLMEHGAPINVVNAQNQVPFDLIMLDEEPLYDELLVRISSFINFMRAKDKSVDESIVSGMSELDINKKYIQKLLRPKEEDAPKSVPVECTVCSDLTVANVSLQPCNHAVACEECSSRMKKCILCKVPIDSRVTSDGRIIPGIERCEKSKIERVNYLESKITEIEEMNMCTICMERCRNTVFLCGHGTCDVCAKTLKFCHMCRKEIEKRISVFL